LQDGPHEPSLIAVRRPCLRCGTLTSGSYCPHHTPAYKRMNPKRGSGGKAATFRRRTLAQTAGRCAVCGSADGVEAHHLRPLGIGGSDAQGGVPLCRRCHRVAHRRRK
jgi:hypothetical protein